MSDSPHHDERGKFKPGNRAAAGNKGGRPRTEASERLRAALEGVVSNGTMPKWQAAMKRKLERGDQWATQFVYERIAGKVPDGLELSGPGGEELIVTLVRGIAAEVDPDTTDSDNADGNDTV